MSETGWRAANRLTPDNEVHLRFYQRAAKQLVCQAMMETYRSIKQPTVDDGPQTVELIPPKTDDRPSWDSLTIIAHAEGEFVPGRGELNVSIQLGQSFEDASGKLDATQLEYVQEYQLFASAGEYRARKHNMFFDYANLGASCVHLFEQQRQADFLELMALSRLLSDSKIRPSEV